MPSDGLTTLSSAHDVKTTIERLETEAKRAGMTIFARIDHAAGAKDAGLTLRPTLLLIFGDARIGTALMQSQPSAGLDLPLKALAFEDDEGNVQLIFNDPVWVASRHRLAEKAVEISRKMSAGLTAFAKKACAPD